VLYQIKIGDHQEPRTANQKHKKKTMSE